MSLMDVAGTCNCVEGNETYRTGSGAGLWPESAIFLKVSIYSLDPVYAYRQMEMQQAKTGEIEENPAWL